MWKPTLLLPILVLLLVNSCANYKLNYALEAQDWEQNLPPDTLPSYSVYLIGDAGSGTTNWTPPTLSALKGTLDSATKNSALVFLGNNTYPDGMAPKSSPLQREQAEVALNHQVDIFANYPGKVFFVAGNHDWDQFGVKGVRRQANYLDKVSNGQAEMLPRPGCGDPIEVELTDDITLLLIDSEWWLANWNGEKEINEDCEAKSRADFAFLLQEAMKSNRRKELIVAMHHPIYSNGPHGGKFTFSEHIFPLRGINDNLYVPLPVIGSFVRFLQSSIGTRQDLANSTYKDLRNLMLNQANTIGDVIFAAGHDHSLQYWDLDQQHFIVSGAGSKTSAAKTGNGALFTYGGYGYAQLNYYPDGQVWVQYFAVNTLGEQHLAYQQKVKPSYAERGDTEEEIIKDEFSENQQQTLPLSTVDFTRTNAGEAIWGKHYRQAYATEMNIRELDLAAHGLIPVKRGGGFQTNSLRLEDTATKRQYTLRSIDKDPSRTVPYPLNTDLILDVVRDNFSASHPIAAVAVAPLAEAAGVYHANPEVVYLPSQKALGDYNKDYAGAIYLFEERPDDEVWEDAAAFGNPEDIVSTFNMIEEVRESHDERIDQRWTIRSRLFDLVIGDWDRHDDQWRWAKIDKGENEYYRPIPRDRDQAFANYDGFIFNIARIVSPKSKQWRPFTDNLGRTHWATYNAFLFDQSFLTDLGWEDWEEAIRHLQTTMTDSIIEASFVQAWPEPFLSRDAPAIIKTIKGRRDKLVDIARDYYTFLAKQVDVLGTDKKDLFLIERIDNAHTRIRVFDTNKKGKREGVFYDRIFLSNETKNIYCYGLGDDDIFEIRGEVNFGVNVHLIGGEGEDEFDDQSVTNKSGRLITIYDFLSEKNELSNTRDSKDRRSKRPQENLYNRRSKAYLHNFNQALPFIGFNPDDRIFIGIKGVYTRYAFRKEPYASQHYYGLIGSISSGGIRANYTGNFSNIIGRWGLQFAGELQTPLYASNYYGLGNETINPEEILGREYNRLRERRVSAGLKLAWRPNDQFELLLGPRLTSTRIERTQGRYIDAIGDQFHPEIFDGIEMMNLEASLRFNNVDQPNFPTRGLRFELNTGWADQLDEEEYNFPFLESELAMYQQLDSRGKLVLATQLGVSHRFTENYPFFLGAQLGGLGPEGNLRGFRRDRFTGRTAFYHNTDLRWKALHWNNNAIPMSIGFSASFDYGKVSLEDIESEKIHYSYGGGAFFTPFDLMTIHIGCYAGNGEELRWLIGGGFFF